MLWLVRFWATISKISTLEDRVLLFFCWLSSFSDTFTLDISRTVTPKPINHTIFWKIFQVHLMLYDSKKYKKWAIFDIIMTTTTAVSMITTKMTSFFSSNLRALSVGIFLIFAFEDLQNSVSWSPPLHYVLVCKIFIYMPKMTLSSLLT